MNSKIASFICDFNENNLSPLIVKNAISAITDTLAVMTAGRADQAVRALEQSLPVYAVASASPISTPGARWRADDAALLLGTASHVLDYDDVSMVTVCHPSAPVLSAMCAAICFGDLSPKVAGKAFIAAFCIGTEVMIRIGQAMGFRHYELGFHPTATLGNIGAAAAIARLAGLSHEQTVHALSIAASMSGGLRNNFGSMVKPLHVGIAAANGLRAVQLAQAGITGAADIFGASGFLCAFSGGATDVWPANVAFGKPFVLEQPGFEQKRYPCCYMLHKIIEASLALRRDNALQLGSIQSARVSLPHGGTRPLNHPYPRTGLNGKFSAPYAVVASIADGRINLASFLDESVLRPQVQSRLVDIQVIEEGETSSKGGDLGNAPVTVCLKLKDGSELAKTITLAPGSPDDPVTHEQLEQKWIDCFAIGKPQVPQAQARGLFADTCRLNELPSVAGWLVDILEKNLPDLRQPA